HLRENDYAAARSLARWKGELGHWWSQVRVDQVQADDHRELPVGTELSIRAHVHLGSVKPDTVAVELYFGRIDPSGRIVGGSSTEMACNGNAEPGWYWYTGKIPCEASGHHGYSLRVMPRHPDLPHRYDTGLLVWG